MDDMPELSDLAYAILTAPGADAAKWRRGKHLSLRAWARIVHNHPAVVLDAMRELVVAGYAVTVPYGKTRVKYIGVPSMTRRVEILAA